MWVEGCYTLINQKYNFQKHFNGFEQKKYLDNDENKDLWIFCCKKDIVATLKLMIDVVNMCRIGILLSNCWFYDHSFND